MEPPKPIETPEQLTGAVNKALEAITSGGSAIPKAWAFGKPLTEEEFKAMREKQNVTTIRANEVLQMRLRHKLSAMKATRSRTTVAQTTPPP